MVEARQALQRLLAGLGEASQFVSIGQLPAVLPGLEVNGIGPIGAPITSADAKRIVGEASQAPYGRGEATIVDTDVRRVWQLEPTQFTLRNDAWSEALAGVLYAVKRDLGIHGKVSAELYKLLVYEKGSFFKPHRDSEKVRGMFGTLVVCLPSRHEGGALILEHDGQTKNIDFGGKDSEFRTRYIAFYADCQHEVAPVTSGYRICLVYNLASGDKKQPKAPHNAAAVSEAARLIKDLFSTPPDELTKLAIPFTHKYTEAGLDPNQLKGSDRARADVLARAALSLDYQCYCALLTLHQEGMPDYGTFDYGGPWSRRRSRWSFDDDEDYEDDDENDSGDDSDGEFEEIFEEELTLGHWLDLEGQEHSLGTIHFEENEILGLEDKKAWSCKQEVQEATGNEGASMERWYRQGAIVMWPRECHFLVLAAEGPASAIPELEKLAANSKTTKDFAVCGQVAEEVIENWHRRESIIHGFDAYSGPMLRVLERIGDKELALRFLREIFAEHFNGSEGKALHGLCQRLGWKAMAPGIQEFLFQQKPANYYTRLNQIVAICNHLCCDPPNLSKERRAACTLIADELMKVIERWDKVRPSRWDDDGFDAVGRGGDSESFDDEPGQGEGEKSLDEADRETVSLRHGNQRSGIVASVVRMLAAIGASKHLTQFLAHVMANARHYDLRAVLIPDVKALYRKTIPTTAGRRAASQLLKHCLTELHAATSHPIKPPEDWKREAKLGCRCDDCVALSRFLRDPRERVGRFPMNKQRRQHLHQQIDEHRCDVKHVTERKGSPQTLVCTKTQDSYERRRKQYGVDTKLLIELKEIEKNQR